MIKVLAFGCMTLAMSVAASAQQSPLIGGTWISSSRTPDALHPGNMIDYTRLAQFLPNGKLIVRDAANDHFQQAREFVTVWQWRMTSSSSYSEVAVDFSPKKICGAGGVCGPAFPTVPMGTRGECQFQIRNSSFVDIGCNGEAPTRFSRH